MNFDMLVPTADMSEALEWMRPAEIVQVSDETTTSGARWDAIAPGATSGVQWVAIADAASASPGATARLREDLAPIEQLLRDARAPGSQGGDLSSLRSALSWPIEQIELLATLARPSPGVREYVKALPNATAVSSAARLLRLAAPLNRYPSRAVAMGDGGAGLIWRCGKRFVEISVENHGELAATWGEFGGTSEDSDLTLDLADLKRVLGFVAPETA